MVFYHVFWCFPMVLPCFLVFSNGFTMFFGVFQWFLPCFFLYGGEHFCGDGIDVFIITHVFRFCFFGRRRRCGVSLFCFWG